ENWGAPKVGRSLLCRLSLAFPRVIAAIERISMSPEPSVGPVAPGRSGPLLACAAGAASASRLDSENSTEFSWRWPVRLEPPPAPLLRRPEPPSAWEAPAFEPNENDGEAG